MQERHPNQLAEYQSRPPPVWPDPVREPSYAMAGDGDRWDAIRKIWRRKWLVLGMGVGFAVAGLVAASLMTPRYTAEARVLLGIQNPRVAKFESVLENITPNADTVRSEAYVVTSREMARKVGYRLALDKSPLFNPALAPEPGLLDRLSISAIADEVKGTLGFDGEATAAPTPGGADASPEARANAEHERLWERIENRLLRDVTVEPLNRSHVLALEVVSTDPAMAAQIANTFGAVYVEEQLVRKREATDKANDWLDSRIDELRQRVEESERAVETYRRENELYATKSDTVIGQQLGALNQELTRTENAKGEAEARLSQAENAAGNAADSETLPSVLQSPLIIDLRGRQAELEREAADLAATYTDRHPRIRNIRAQIVDVNSKIDGEIGRIIAGLRNQLSIANSHHQRVVERMDNLQNRVGETNAESVKLRELEREAEANRTLLESLLQRSKETTEQVGLMTPNAEILSRAAVPGSPSFPPTNLILVLAAFVGFGGGILLALLVETLDQTFRSSDEVEEYTGLPTLAVVPAIKTRSRGRFDHVVRNPHSIFSNSLRMLNTFLSRGQESSTVGGLVIFTSAVPGEGKSHTSCGFAQLLAAEGRNVVLVDFDWRQPTQHKLFGQRRSVGVIELLTGKYDPETVLYHDEASGVDVLFAGDVKSMQGRPVSVERLQLLLHTLSRHYDVIILDTSPTMITPEVLCLAQLADHVVMNVKWGSTTRRAVTTEIKNLMRAGARVSGVVLTQVDLNRYSKYSYADGGYFRSGYLRFNPR